MVMTLKITKYKKSTKGRYKVFLEDGTELLLYEEVILQFQLLLLKEISSDLFMEVGQYNQEWDVYYVALNHLNSHFKSVHDMEEWLLRKEYPKELIEKAVQKLIHQGYLNDRSYAKSYIHNQMIASHKGPYALLRDLKDKKIEESIILEEMQVFTEEEQCQRIQKLIEKFQKSNRTRGGVVLKQKIFHDLKNLGYDISLIQKEIEKVSFENDKDLAKKEYEKLYRKYSRKYEGQELEKLIQKKLFQKGLQYEEE